MRMDPVLHPGPDRQPGHHRAHVTRHQPTTGHRAEQVHRVDSSGLAGTEPRPDNVERLAVDADRPSPVTFAMQHPDAPTTEVDINRPQIESLRTPETGTPEYR
jgi:hypothetical protein